MSETREIDYPDLTWLGTIVGPHGVQGELKVYPLTDDLNFYCKSLKYFLRENAKGFEKINIKNLKIHKGIWILKCRECGGRNLAESWKKSRLLVNDEDLRPLGDDEVFLHQIKGHGGGGGRGGGHGCGRDGDRGGGTAGSGISCSGCPGRATAGRVQERGGRAELRKGRRC